MMIKVLLAAATVLTAFIIVAALQPAEFKVSRSIAIAASPSAVAAWVNDFHQWAAWSPWEKMDPDMQRTFSGPPTGVGQTYAWASKKVGEGRMTMVSSRPERIELRLDFLKPFNATNSVQFDFKPEGGGTVVTWSMTGRKNLFAKALHLVVNMDKMIGGDYEKGLAAMKTLAERNNSKENL